MKRIKEYTDAIKAVQSNKNGEAIKVSEEDLEKFLINPIKWILEIFKTNKNL